MDLSSAFRRAKQMRTNASAIVTATSDPEETPPSRLHDRTAITTPHAAHTLVTSSVQSMHKHCAITRVITPHSHAR
eukprot:6068243-Pyramimonas_sp.AAC.1